MYRAGLADNLGCVPVDARGSGRVGGPGIIHCHLDDVERSGTHGWLEGGVLANSSQQHLVPLQHDGSGLLQPSRTSSQCSHSRITADGNTHA